MTQVILQPAGDPDARRHYADTIATPVPLERLARFLPPDDVLALREIYGERSVPTWGVTPGGRDVNHTKWERIQPGDLVLMAREGELFVSARVTYKTQSEQAAEDLWGRNDDGETWQYLYFVDDLEAQSIPVEELNEAAGYRANARVQAFQVLDRVKSDRILSALEARPVRLDAASYLRSLRGQTISTMTGRPNRIMDVEGDQVIVGTERSPEGQPVPLEWVQDAMDRLTSDGMVEVAVEAVGHRSAFVGAVLATLPGTRRQTNPPRVVLESPPGTTLTRGWREPPEVLDALDAVDDLAGNRRPRPRPSRQSAAQNRAIEARAVAAAIDYFRARGWDVEDVGTRGSYDLRCRKNDKSLHVEVKGTTSPGRKVLLTRNEVHHARGTDSELALFVLSGIETTNDEAPIASGGNERVFHPWAVDETSLDPIAYEYTLPLDSSEPVGDP